MRHRRAVLAGFVVALLTLPAAAAGLEPLPDGVPGTGAHDVRRAWLVGPTDRYRHAVLGDAIEAAGLRVERADGSSAEFLLPGDSVFEDLQPRVVDLDRDGLDEVLVVRSRADAGSSLAVLGLREGELVLLAESDPIGTPHRWLNPVGAADLDGDGRLEVALVRTPHIGGTLEVYAYADGRLTRRAALTGFSNHALGQRALRLAVLIDADGDGVPDIVIPTADRQGLAVVGFRDGRLEVLRRTALPGRVVGDATVISASPLRLSLPLEDGSLAEVRP